MANDVIKNRYWSLIAYPDSLPDNWHEILDDWLLPVAVSPLHDKDLMKDGTLKKAHYHIIIAFSGPTTYKNVSRIIEPLNCTIPKQVLHMRNMIDYLTHENHPDRYHYNKEDRLFYGGFDPEALFELTTIEIDEIVHQLQAFIMDNDLTEYSDLLDACFNSNNREWYQVARKNTIFFNNYITSRRERAKRIKRDES